MVVPLAGRWVAAAAGAALVLTAWARRGARGDRVRRRRDRPDNRRPADRLPAGPVRGVQPEGNRGGAAERAGRRPVLGAGTACAHPLRPGFGRLGNRCSARAVRPVATLGRRRGGEPHHLPAAGALPLTPAAVILGDRAAGRAGFRRADPDTVPRLRARR